MFDKIHSFDEKHGNSLSTLSAWNNLWAAMNNYQAGNEEEMKQA